MKLFWNVIVFLWKTLAYVHKLTSWDMFQDHIIKRDIALRRNKKHLDFAAPLIFMLWQSPFVSKVGKKTWKDFNGK
jgi:hypothetical protein